MKVYTVKVSIRDPKAGSTLNRGIVTRVSPATFCLVKADSASGADPFLHLLAVNAVIEDSRTDGGTRLTPSLLDALRSGMASMQAAEGSL